MSKYALPPKPAEQNIISEESALAQVMDFLSYYDIDVARITDEVQRQVTETTLDHFTDLVRQGRVEIRRDPKDSKLEVVQHLSNGQEVVYSEMSAAAKLAMDRHPQEANYGRMYAMLGSLSSLGSEAIQKFPARDLAVLDIIGPLFRSA